MSDSPERIPDDLPESGTDRLMDALLHHYGRHGKGADEAFLQRVEAALDEAAIVALPDQGARRGGWLAWGSAIAALFVVLGFSATVFLKSQRIEGEQGDMLAAVAEEAREMEVAPRAQFGGAPLERFSGESAPGAASAPELADEGRTGSVKLAAKKAVASTMLALPSPAQAGSSESGDGWILAAAAPRVALSIRPETGEAEGLVGRFAHRESSQGGGEAVVVDLESARSPGASGRTLVRIGIQAGVEESAAAGRNATGEILLEPSRVRRYRIVGRGETGLPGGRPADRGPGEEVTVLLEVDPIVTGEIGTVAIRYEDPETGEAKLTERPIEGSGRDWREASDDFRLAAAGMLYGRLLRGDAEEDGGATRDDLRILVEDGFGLDETGERAEFVARLREALAEGEGEAR